MSERSRLILERHRLTAMIELDEYKTLLKNELLHKYNELNADYEAATNTVKEEKRRALHRFYKVSLFCFVLKLFVNRLIC